MSHRRRTSSSVACASLTLSAAIASLSALGCAGTAQHDPSGDGGDGAGPAAAGALASDGVRGAGAFARFQRPRLVDPSTDRIELRPLLPAAAATIREEAGALVPSFASARVGRGAGLARLRAPLAASGAFRVEDADSGLSIEVGYPGAAPVRAATGDGYVRYAGALAGVLGGGGDVLLRPHEEGLEDYVLVEQSPPAPRVEYRVTLGQGVAGLRLVGNVLEWLSSDGDPRLRVAEPLLVDARGVEHVAKLTVEGCAVDTDVAPPWGRPPVDPGARTCTVVIGWDAAVIAYPAVLDPAWTTTTSMTAARSDFTLTRYTRLSVNYWVAAGGRNASGTALNTTSIYSESAGTWTSGDTFTGARYHHRAVSLAGIQDSNDFLIAGGTDGTTWRDTTRVWDGDTGTWSAGGTMTLARSEFTLVKGSAAVLYAIGGRTGSASGNVTSTIEDWVPAFGWTSNPTALDVARYGAAGVPISSTGDAVLIAGGKSSDSGSRLSTAVKLTRSSGTTITRTAAASMTQGRFQPSAVQVSGAPTQAFVVGGAAGGSSVAAEWYDDSSGAWTSLPAASTNFGYPVSVQTSVGRRFLVAGPGLYPAVLYDLQLGAAWSAGSFTSTGYNNGAGALLSAGANANKVLAAGGGGAGANATVELWWPQAQGSACTGPGECTAGVGVTPNCVDGRCCESACAGACASCSNAHTGQANGLCRPVTAGTDPAAECPDDGAASCDRDGMCNGAGACRLYGSSTTCQSPTCASGTQTGYHCNGGGQCIGDTQTQCSPYLCAGSTCGTSCSTDAQCATDRYCAATQCVPKKATGAACGGANECTSGNCVDSFCCNSACGSACQACSAALKQSGTGDGQCGPAAAGLADGCLDQGASSCGTNGLCDGSGACSLYVAATPCGAATCAVATQTDYHCDGAGACVGDTNTPCAPYLCSGSACGTTCSTSDDCSGTHYCEGTACVAKKINGTACASGGECTTGECVDGVCCDTACAGTCQSCVGLGSDGTCKDVGAGSDPDSDCALEPACGRDGECDGAGACRLKQGTPCGTTPQCITNVETHFACDGAGNCATAQQVDCAPGVCSSGVCPAAGCTGAGDCLSTHFCDLSGGSPGTCALKRNLGQACAIGGECQSGFCADGVCCDASCAGACERCSAAGNCVPQANGTDPDGDCSVEAGCGRDGECNGARQCRLKDGSFVCSTPQCSGNVEKHFQCNGAGACVEDSAAAVDCAATGYVCSGGQCLATCSSDTHCIGGHFCDTGTCQPKRALGAACSAATACQSGSCADGVCCDGACTGTCERCTAAGTCAPIATGTDPENECSPEAGCGRDGQCDGLRGCRLKQGVACGTSPQCVSNVETHYACDGSGNCVESGTTDCGLAGSVCAGGACPSSCTSDGQCLGTHFCDLGAGVCVVRRGLGAACTGTSQCDSGFCADGVCCDVACAGACVACTAAAKGEGSDGYCGTVVAGTDPGDDCPVASDCGTDGVCDGAGACRLKQGVPCGAAQCVGTISTRYQCAGNGNCEVDAALTVECSPSACTAGFCTGSCVTAGDCASGYFCDAGSCAPTKAAGAPCSGVAECTSGFCVDGVCCATQCGGPCAACSAATKGQGLDGECGSVIAGTDPDDDCAAAGGCGADGTCNGAGGCRLAQPSVGCGSPQCVTNAVTAQHCDGAGSCVNDATGTSCGTHRCSAGACSTPCTADTDCVVDHFCDSTDGACKPELAQGTPCTAASQCATGHCADGFCCDVACTTGCQACSAALKESGVDGECGPAKAGTDPRGSCPDDGAALCQRDGQCDAAGSCRVYPHGAACGATQCSGNTVTGRICDGTGACVTDSAGVACAPYLCFSGGCASSCQTNSDCLGAHYCDATSLTCEPKGQPGETCGAAVECASGFCVDGVCCDTECTGQCEACDVTGSEGTCAATSGAPHGARAQCDGPDPACNGTCNGAYRAACTYPGDQVLCGSSRCEGGSLRLSRCDGNGACVADQARDCGAYACDSTALDCKATCTTNADCAAGAECDTTAEVCAFVSASCSDPFTVRQSDGTEQSCAPYRCVAGACQSTCVSNADCATGYECSSGACVESTQPGTGGGPGTGGQGGGGGSAGTPAGAAPTVTQESGCGCRVPAPSRGSRGAWALIALAGAAAASRRRAAASRAR